MFSEQELESIRRIAEAVVSEIAPGEKSYFPVVWEEFLARDRTVTEPKKSGFIAGLFVDKGPKLKLVSQFAILVVAEVCAEADQSLGTPELEVIRQATVAAAKCLGLPSKLVENLAEHTPRIIVNELNSVMRKGAPQPEFSRTQAQIRECVAFYREPGDNKLKRCTGSAEKLDGQFFKLQGCRFTIFVDCLKGEVRILNCSQLVSLHPRERNLLALLLLHFGRRVPYRQAVRWAWPTGSHIKFDERLMRSNLRGPVRMLRKRLSSVKHFGIPHLRRGENYYCTETKEGECTFCILLPAEMDDSLRQMALYPAIQ